MNGSVVVDAPCGLLRGTVVAGVDPGVVAFKGIPYAAPPVGVLRWRPPQPAPRWAGIRDALTFGPDFPQKSNARMRAPRQDEDCLYLNVWAPADTARTRRPVMVWFHGGGFTGGSGSDERADGAQLAARGAVVVSFNYRSGLFGFFAHRGLSAESEHRTSGNYGLLDQIAALRWVAANIEAFGGDPSSVCVFGVSAGSASISLLLASPSADGLFHRAILHSPGAGRPLAALEGAESAGAAALGADIAALRALGAHELFALTGRLTPAVRGLTTPRVLRPIHDGWVVPEDERAALKAGRFRALPLVVGSNRDEGSLLTANWPIETLADYRHQVETNFRGAEPEVEALYPALHDVDARRRVAEMFADTQFNYGTRLLAQAMSAREPRTWRYLFTRRPPGQADGPHHGDEVSYVFGNLDCGNLDSVSGAGAGAHDRAVSRAMMSAWVAFARGGDPNTLESPAWTAYSRSADNHLEFGDEIRAGGGWRRAQLDFVDRCYDRAFA